MCDKRNVDLGDLQHLEYQRVCIMTFILQKLYSTKYNTGTLHIAFSLFSYFQHLETDKNHDEREKKIDA